MTSPMDIAGYTYNAENYCPRCIISVLPTQEGGVFDGWALAEGATETSVEETLDEIAHAFGFNREDESNFDSGDFPKIVFFDMVTNEEDENPDEGINADRCGACGELLGD